MVSTSFQIHTLVARRYTQKTLTTLGGTHQTPLDHTCNTQALLDWEPLGTLGCSLAPCATLRPLDTHAYGRVSMRGLLMAINSTTFSRSNHPRKLRKSQNIALKRRNITAHSSIKVNRLYKRRPALRLQVAIIQKTTKRRGEPSPYLAFSSLYLYDIALKLWSPQNIGWNDLSRQSKSKFRTMFLFLWLFVGLLQTSGSAENFLGAYGDFKAETFDAKRFLKAVNAIKLGDAYIRQVGAFLKGCNRVYKLK